MSKTVFQDRRQQRSLLAQDRCVEVAQAAWSVIARDGLERASMRNIAREMGCTTGVLSHYFRDKDALLRFTIEQVIDAVAQHAAEHPDAGNNRGSYCTYLLTLLPVDAEGLQYWRAWIDFVGTAIHHKDMNDLHTKAYERFRKNTMMHLASLQNNGALCNKSNIAELANVVICFIDGLGLHASLSPQNWPMEKQRTFVKNFISRNLPTP